MAKTTINTQRWEELAEQANYDARELARLCRLSDRQLRRTIRRCLGRSAQNWLNERRVIASRRLLLSGHPVKEVAFQLGYKQPSHFCRQFKMYHDLTPSEFVLKEAQVAESALDK